MVEERGLAEPPWCPDLRGAQSLAPPPSWQARLGSPTKARGAALPQQASGTAGATIV